MNTPNTHSTLHRRSVLTGSASALAMIGLASWSRGSLAQTAVVPKPLPAYVSWKDASSVIVHSGTTIETKRLSLIHISEPTRPY